MFKRNKQGKLVKDYFSILKRFFKKDINEITQFLLKAGNKRK